MNGSAPPFVALTLLSALTAAGAVFAMRRLSNQQALASVKRQIHADLLEIRLFNDSPWRVVRASVAAAVDNWRYFRLSVVPGLVIAIPVVLAWPYLEAFFALAPLQSGDTVTVSAQWRSDVPLPANAPAALNLVAERPTEVETPTIWFPILRRAVWRITAGAPGHYAIGVHAAGNVYTKSFDVGDADLRSSTRERGSFIQRAWYPHEDLLPESSPLEAIIVEYPARRFPLFGREWHWATLYMIQSMVFAMVMSRWPRRRTFL